MPERIPVGQAVPDFTLPGTNGRDVSLSDFRGKKVLLYFFPEAGTPGCTKQACEFRDVAGELTATGVEIVGISPDETAKQERFAGKHGLPFLLLADTEHKVCELFDVWKQKNMYGHKYMGVVRSTFLIDEQGRLAKEWRRLKLEGHVQTIVQALRAL